MPATATWRGKRVFDVLLGGLLALCTAPVSLLIAGWVRLDAGSPVLFRQRRVGLHGAEFAMLKFRTMVVNAVEVGRAAGLSEDVHGVVENDFRVTRSGRFLRRTGLDELPQLVNVLRGQMSLVGPRPDIPEQVAHYSAADRERLAGRPGITGLAQVLGRDQIDWPARIELDKDYLRRVSLRLDLWILGQTVRELFRHDAAPLFDAWNATRTAEREP